MKNTIETLEEAIENSCKISANYYPNGEIVQVIQIYMNGKVSVEFQDGTEELVDRGDLIDFTWKQRGEN